MKNLISNTDFGKYLDNFELSLSEYKQVRQKFDSFLLLALEVGMFVPCDENGEILEEPVWQQEWEKGKVAKFELCLKSLRYKQAKERCLFEGFIFKAENEKSFTVELDGETFWIEKNETIEDLLGFDHEFELTPTAQKKIGIWKI